MDCVTKFVREIDFCHKVFDGNSILSQNFINNKITLINKIFTFINNNDKDNDFLIHFIFFCFFYFSQQSTNKKKLIQTTKIKKL